MRPEERAAHPDVVRERRMAEFERQVRACFATVHQDGDVSLAYPSADGETWFELHIHKGGAASLLEHDTEPVIPDAGATLKGWLACSYLSAFAAGSVLDPAQGNRILRTLVGAPRVRGDDDDARRKHVQRAAKVLDGIVSGEAALRDRKVARK